MIRVFVPLAGFLCAAAAIGPRSPRWGDAAIAMLPALLLLFQFRLWDDLADRDQDALEHPDRVLPASDSVAAYRWLASVTAALNIVIAVTSATPLHVAVLIALNLSFLAWYGRLRKYLESPLLHAHVVLLKYPAFVFILNGIIAAGSAQYPVYPMLVTYLAFCIYEILHDPALRRSPRAFGVLVGESAVLVVAPLGLLAGIQGGVRLDDSVPLAMSALTAIALAILIIGYRYRPASRSLRVGPVLVAVVQVFMLNMGSGP